MKKCKVLLFSVLVLAFVGTVANANITLNWQANASGTFQSWTPPIPGNADVDLNPFGMATAAIDVPNKVLTLVIPNREDLALVKILQLEVHYTGGGGISGYDAIAAGSVTTMNSASNNGSELNVQWTITPQPNTETVYVYWTGADPTFNQIDVATVCNIIPAPAALFLTGIGTGLVGLLRRRRTI